MIITVLMPARLHLTTAAFASPRGGSSKPTSPKKVSSCSIPVSFTITPSSKLKPFKGCSATASTRSASCASKVLTWSRPGAIALGQFPYSLAGTDQGATAENNFGRAFDKCPGLAFLTTDDGHAFAIGIERHSSQTRHFSLNGRAGNTAFRGGYQQRPFG